MRSSNLLSQNRRSVSKKETSEIVGAFLENNFDLLNAVSNLLDESVKSIFIGILLFNIGLLHAQTDFRPGYVITNANDTLFGEIDYRGDRMMGQVCKFRSDKREIVEYTPYDIAAYRFPDNKYFVSKDVLGTKVFLEYLIKGQANIYYLRDDAGNHYYIEKEDIPLTEISYDEGIREINGKKFFYTTKTHSVILNYFMQDAPGVQKQISNMKQPARDELIKLAKDYHHAVCTNDEPCIVFEKKLPPVKVAVDIVGGIVYYPEYTNALSLTGGVILNLWLPRINEKLFFRTGLLYSQYEETNEYDSKIYGLYRIPLMVEYIYPKSIIRPKFAFGWSAYVSSDFGVFPMACMGGFNIRLSASMSISLEYNVDFSIFNQYAIHSFLGGFHFRF